VEFRGRREYDSFIETWPDTAKKPGSQAGEMAGSVAFQRRYRT
jgi:hypothetical protein